MMGGAIFEVV